MLLKLCNPGAGKFIGRRDLLGGWGCSLLAELVKLPVVRCFVGVGTVFAGTPGLLLRNCLATIFAFHDSAFPSKS